MRGQSDKSVEIGTHLVSEKKPLFISSKLMSLFNIFAWRIKKKYILWIKMDSGWGY
jgi:hypothetical protein